MTSGKYEYDSKDVTIYICVDNFFLNGKINERTNGVLVTATPGLTTADDNEVPIHVEYFIAACNMKYVMKDISDYIIQFHQDSITGIWESKIDVVCMKYASLNFCMTSSILHYYYFFLNTYFQFFDHIIDGGGIVLFREMGEGDTILTRIEFR